MIILRYVLASKLTVDDCDIVFICSFPITKFYLNKIADAIRF